MVHWIVHSSGHLGCFKFALKVSEVVRGWLVGQHRDCKFLSGFLLQPFNDLPLNHHLADLPYVCEAQKPFQSNLAYLSCTRFQMAFELAPLGRTQYPGTRQLLLLVSLHLLSPFGRRIASRYFDLRLQDVAFLIPLFEGFVHGGNDPRVLHDRSDGMELIQKVSDGVLGNGVEEPACPGLLNDAQFTSQDAVRATARLAHPSFYAGPINSPIGNAG